MPENKLLLVKNGSYVKWCESDGSSSRYISKKERFLAEQLALKKLYLIQLDELMAKQQLLDKILADYIEMNSCSTSQLIDSDCYQELLAPFFDSHPDTISQWLDSEYPKNASHPENLIHNTVKGHKVRSKSEVIIANALYQNKIPYIYERGLYLDEILFFPDFTIMHPETFQIYYWEHFGMIDNTSYC